MQRNGSFPAPTTTPSSSSSNPTNAASSSSSTSKLFSRSGSLFVSNRKAREAKERAAQVAAAAAVHTSPATIASKGKESNSTPSIADTSSTSTPDEHARTPSDTSLPSTLIPARTSSKSSKRPHRHSHSATNIDLGNLRRSISLRSVTSPHKHSFTHTRGSSTENNSAATTPPTTISPPLHTQSSKPLLHIPAFAKRQKSADALSSLTSDTASPIDTVKPAMSTVSYRSGQVTTGRPPAASISSSSGSGGIGSMQVPPPQAGSQTPQMVYQHIMDTASKRISTLDYLRKAHEGRVYWFNTLLFTKPDLLKFSYFQPAKLARRATNYLLLGFSLPTILDLNSQTPTEYLKALNALLVEFEQYQQLHPPDGSIPSSLSRARVPQMFKRTTGKSRRQSSATDFSSSLSSTPEGSSTLSSGSAFSLPTGDSALLPQENYQHLLTPSLPFDPDFFETFATLCDVLIDCYTKVTQLIRDPEMCKGAVGELFGKADARVRKVIVAGVVREFEERCREGVKSEVAGVGKVVLGGLM